MIWGIINQMKWQYITSSFLFLFGYWILLDILYEIYLYYFSRWMESECILQICNAHIWLMMEYQYFYHQCEMLKGIILIFN